MRAIVTGAARGLGEAIAGRLAAHGGGVVLVDSSPAVTATADRIAAASQSAGPVTGYRSPSWDLSPHTLDLLLDHGLRYSSNLMDDIRPYPIEGRPLVEVPISWILDDAAHFWFDGASWTKNIANTADVRAIWEAEFEGIRTLGGAAVFTMHPQIIGRPGRLAFLDSFLSFVTGHDDVWVATAGEIAGRV